MPTKGAHTIFGRIITSMGFCDFCGEKNCNWGTIAFRKCCQKTACPFIIKRNLLAILSGVFYVISMEALFCVVFFALCTFFT